MRPLAAVFLAAALAPDTFAAAGIDGGAFHNCAVDSAGSVYCWGSNTSGQVGDGLIVSALKVDAEGIFSASAIAAGTIHTCAVQGGSVFCWGTNEGGELGLGVTGGTRATPAAVPGLNDVSALALGSGFSCALRAGGTVACWGVGSFGQLGNGLAVVPRPTPAAVTGITGATAIVAGNLHACALTGPRRVQCWGANRNGQLGDGTTTNRMTPVDVQGLTADVASIAAADEHTCIVDVAGGVRCWGDNSGYQLGDATTTARSTPVAVQGLSSGVRQVAAAQRRTCALMVVGSVLCWGAGGGVVNTFPPPTAVPGLVGATALDGGQFHFCAVVGTGVKCWQGTNVRGELGDGTTNPTATSVDVIGVPAGVRALALGSFYSCALLASGGVRCWGDNFNGQLGGEFPGEYNFARRILTGAVAVGAGYRHSCAVLASTEARCWGSNASGQLGDGTNTDRPLPATVVGSGYRAVALGGTFSCALTTANSVKCWGSQNNVGSNPANSRVPNDVTGLSSGVTAVTAGSSHACALLSSGSVACWGSNNSGQLGDGTTTNRQLAVPVSGLTGATAISAGSNYTCALLGDGTVRCWGGNTFGQLGDGTTTNRLTPVAVTVVPDRMRSLSAGYLTTCAVTDTGSARCWGEFATMFLRAAAVTRGVPVAALNNGIAAITQGDSHVCAMLEQGGVRCFGANSSAQLGDGTKVTSRRSPESVVGPDQRSFLDLTPEDGVISERLPPFVVVAKGSGTNIEAAFAPRPQDVGTVASTYVFAVAPADSVRPAAAGDEPLVMGKAASAGKADDTPVACVLAQLNTTGQLQAVSASSLQAYVTGVLTSTSAAVTVLNGVTTANIGGSTFFVGYGTSAGTMLSGGLNRSVVSVGGTRECKPQPPEAGWWWNANEGGRGYSIEVQGNKIFYAAFLYDDAGRAAWNVATGLTSLDGSLFTGDLLRVAGGQTLGGAYQPPGPAQSVGPFTLAFSDDRNGTMVWPGGTVAIERFDIVTNGLEAAPRAGQPETGWWWNPAESGRGFFIEWQDGVADLAGYMYDDAGNPVWYLSVQQTPNMQVFSGSWWLYANGQSLTGAYKPATRINDNVAPVTINFTSATTATMMLPNGRTTALQRHRF